MCLRLSVDFDCTLSTIEVQQFVLEFKSKKIAPVSIVTSRLNNSSSENEDLFEIADALGIVDINFTNLVDKVEFFIDNPQFLVHIDDCPHEIKFMTENKKCSTVGILWQETFDWESQVLKLFIRP